MKVVFKGEFDLEEAPDDRGSVDNWIVDALEKAVKKGRRSETGLEALGLLKISWVLEDN